MDTGHTKLPEHTYIFGYKALIEAMESADEEVRVRLSKAIEKELSK
jgi:hypothetical protein